MSETFDARRAEPGQQFVWHDEWGNPVRAKADDEGVLRPRNASEVRLADAFGLPIARGVAAKAARTPRGKKPAAPAIEEPTTSEAAPETAEEG